MQYSLNFNSPSSASNAGARFSTGEPPLVHRAWVIRGSSKNFLQKSPSAWLSVRALHWLAEPVSDAYKAAFQSPPKTPASPIRTASAIKAPDIQSEPALAADSLHYPAAPPCALRHRSTRSLRPAHPAHHLAADYRAAS